jgi:FtsZ-interacting cell division protein ZipA
VETGTIVLIIVIAVIVLALIGLFGWMSNKKKREHRHAEAERIRHEAAAGTGGIQESEVRAREAEARAEQARLQAERAEQDAARAHQGVTQEQAQHEERIREADRIDPAVDHRSEGYTPDTSAAATSRPAYDETGRVDPSTTGTADTTGTTGTTGHAGTSRVDEHGRPIEDPSEPGGTHRAP